MNTQMNLNLDIVLIPEGDETTSLWDLVDRYDRKVIIPPLHQRDTRAWDDAKKREWIYRISNRQLKPVGVIVTYQLNDGSQSPTYLNDGLQRVAATSEYKNSPELYGDTKIRAEEIIRSIRMPWQHRHYKTHDDALQDFQRLNIGTALTPFEYFAGILRYMPCYELHWHPLLDRVHEIVNSRVLSLYPKINRGREGRKKQKHQGYRSNYGLFYRFISGDTSRTAYKTASHIVRLGEIAIESKLKSELLRVGVEEAGRQLVMFQSMIERETDLIEMVWQRTATGKNIQIGLMPNLYRHLMDVAIWKRNSSVSTDLWKDYVERLLSNTQGAASVINPENSRERSPLALNDLGKLATICKIIGSELYISSQIGKQKNKRDKRIKPGYDISHLVGLGISDETVLEPAGLNRARGARTMTEKELEFVSPNV